LLPARECARELILSFAEDREELQNPGKSILVDRG
jgi:hypothetical protein